MRLVAVRRYVRIALVEQAQRVKPNRKARQRAVDTVAAAFARAAQQGSDDARGQEPRTEVVVDDQDGWQLGRLRRALERDHPGDAPGRLIEARSIRPRPRLTVQADASVNDAGTHCGGVARGQAVAREEA